MSTPKCTVGIRHAWRWVADMNQISVRGSSVSISLKGAYRCDCGARKLGEFQSVEVRPPGAATPKGGE